MDGILFLARFRNMLLSPDQLSFDDSLSCALDRDKCKRYIEIASHVDPLLGNAVKVILDNTTYVSHEDLRRSIREAAESFVLSIGDTPYVILVDNSGDNPDRRFNSEHLMIYWTWDILEKTNLQGIYHYQDDIPSHISIAMWIDDCLYTGGNASEIMSRQYRGEYNDGGARFDTIHIVLGYSSRHNQRIIEEYLSISLIFHIGVSIPLYTDICCIPIEDYYFSWDQKPMIYFDHKIAFMDSTFSHIYDGKIPDRKLTEEEKMNDRFISVGWDIGPLPINMISRDIIHRLESLFYMDN